MENEFNDIVLYKKTGKYPSKVKDRSNWNKKCKNYEFKDNKLYYNYNKHGPLEVVNDRERVGIMVKMHGEDHFGINKMRKEILRKYYWKGIQKDVKQYVETCKKCNIAKQQKEENTKINQKVSLIVSSYESKMNNLKTKNSNTNENTIDNLPLQRFHLSIYVDVLSPIVLTKKVNLYYMVLTNKVTKKSEGFVLDKISEERISDYIYEYTLRNGYPIQVFLSQSCMNYVKFQEKIENKLDTKIKKEFFQINTDSKVLIFNSKIKYLLDTFINSLPHLQDKWVEHISILMLSYNTFEGQNESPYSKNSSFLQTSNSTAVTDNTEHLKLWAKRVLNDFRCENGFH